MFWKKNKTLHNTDMLKTIKTQLEIHTIKVEQLIKARNMLQEYRKDIQSNINDLVGVLEDTDLSIKELNERIVKKCSNK